MHHNSSDSCNQISLHLRVQKVTNRILSLKNRQIRICCISQIKGGLIFMLASCSDHPKLELLPKSTLWRDWWALTIPSPKFGCPQQVIVLLAGCHRVCSTQAAFQGCQGLEFTTQVILPEGAQNFLQIWEVPSPAGEGPAMILAESAAPEQGVISPTRAASGVMQGS